jgi:hypothetical protein
VAQRWWLAAALALCSFVPGSARAHGQDAHIASVRISGDTVYIDATPSSAAVANFDDDRNGLMRSEEVKAHREELLSFFDSAFRVFDEHGQRGQRIFADVSTPHVHDGTKPEGAEHLRFTFRYRFAAEPRKLRVQWFEAARDPLTVRAVRSLASKLLHEQRPVGVEESVTLTELQPAAFLLALPAPLEAEKVSPERESHPVEPRGFGSPLRLELVLLGATVALTGALLWVWRRLRRHS